MKLDIFNDSAYIEKLDDLFHIYELSPNFPFSDYDIDPFDLIDNDGYDSTNLYNFLKQVKFLYYFDQKYIGYVEINSVGYIIEIDSESTISIIGDNPINWTRNLFSMYQKENLYNDFKHFCLNHYNIHDDEPDYEKFIYLQEKYLCFDGT